MGHGSKYTSAYNESTEIEDELLPITKVTFNTKKS